MTHSIQVKDLTLSFGSVSVLKNMNIDVAEGEFIVLLGPSGCGQSTLLNCLAGLLDMRLPLTLTPEDACQIDRIIRAEVLAVHQQGTTT